MNADFIDDDDTVNDEISTSYKLIENKKVEFQYSVMHQNVQYSFNKKDEIEIFLDIEKPDIFLMSEHGLKGEEIEVFHLNNYNLIDSYCRSKMKGGGMAIFAKESLCLEAYNTWKDNYCIEGLCESVAARWILEDMIVVIIAIYRPPRMSCAEFFEILYNMLESVLRPQTRLIVMGDMNIDMLKHDNKTMEYIDILSNYGLKQIINTPTRVTTNTATIIDHVVTNINDDQYCARVLNGFISDHFAQKFILKLKDDKKVKNNKISSWSRDMNDINVEHLCNVLEKEEWKEVLISSDTNDKLTQFLNIFNYCLDITCPLNKKTHKPKRRGKPWITNKIIQFRDELKTSYEKSIETKEKEDELKYKVLKYKYRNLIREEKRNHVKLIFDSDNISKSSWKFINEERGKYNKKDMKNITLRINQSIISSPNEVADVFNNYYIEVADDLKSNKPLCLQKKTDLKIITKDPLIYNENSIFFYATDENEINLIFNKLKNKKSVGFDGISTVLLKKCRKHLITPLVDIINKSIEEGIFPNDLKIGIVKPIFKKGNREEMQNYRPITLLSGISKIFEYVILNRLLNFIEKNNILVNEQFGFREKRSTGDAISNLLHSVFENLNSHNKVGGIFLDQKKAFDCVDHSILLHKIEKYGIRGIPLKWMTSYISNRKQYVEILSSHNAEVIRYKSNLKTITCGVPQGSILGPILFILYINEIGRGIGSKLTMYADDISLICSNKSIIELNSSINKDIEILKNNLDSLNLHLSEQKSKCIFFNLKGNNTNVKLDIRIENSTIEEVENWNFLGLKVDNKLKWKFHIDTLCNKISSNLFILRRLTGIAGLDMMKTIYYGLIFSNLKYGIMAWGAAAKIYMNRAFVLQKRAIRYMGKLGPRASCRDLFIKFEILTVFAIYLYEVITFAKYYDSLVYNSKHEHYTRNKKYKQVPMHNLEIFKKDAVIAGIRYFSRLPNNIKVIENRRLFCKNLKKYLASRCLYCIEDL